MSTNGRMPGAGDLCPRCYHIIPDGVPGRCDCRPWGYKWVSVTLASFADRVSVRFDTQDRVCLRRKASIHSLKRLADLMDKWGWRQRVDLHKDAIYLIYSPPEEGMMWIRYYHDFWASSGERALCAYCAKKIADDADPGRPYSRKEPEKQTESGLIQCEHCKRWGVREVWEGE